ncbi:MAG: multicopper oxidase domain-containing protein [Gammaproteobacteria bacterium]|nr:multicopper oxidase domain-containing protein [Gammaproteobacteria bacterium]
MKTNQSAVVGLLAALALACAPCAVAKVPGIGGTPAIDAPASCPAVAPGASSGTTRDFELTARAGHITLGDGNTLYSWGLSTDGAAAADSGAMQYPGPTLIVCEGDLVRVRLHNQLPDAVSLLFPGQGIATASGDGAGLLTSEAAALSGTADYSFIAQHAGTYQYHSGTQPEVQVEMGLLGALIVRPGGFADGTYAAHDVERRAYGAAGAAASAYDVEYLFFLSEMDRAFHEAMEDALRNPATVARPNAANLKETLWFINGRNGPDTMIEQQAAWLPSQPYNALAQMHPGDRVLMRLIAAGRDLHPFHHHGNNAWLIARDGRVLESIADSAVSYPDDAGVPDLVALNRKLPDQAVSNFTIQTVPGGTYDAIFTWTGKLLNWDVYGHLAGHVPGAACTAATRLPFEDPDSHCKAFPVTLPEQQQLQFGGLWSGSPFLGNGAPLPPLQGGLNPNGGFSFMWHSHTERELTNDDIFPGGMMTMMIVQAADSAAVIE